MNYLKIMIKKNLLFQLLLVTCSLFGQKTDFSNDWMNLLENPKYEWDSLKPENLIETYQDYDYSTLLVPRTEVLGYIGSDYRKINIYFLASFKGSNKNEYKIKGVSLVANNKCDFAGTITITQIREYENLHFGIDNVYKNKGIVAEGMLIGDYRFEENEDQPHSGEFTGIMTIYWYLDKFGIFHYDRIQWYSDTYKNNQYIGIWKDYSTGQEKPCNWGEYRIPFSGDLDIGTAEFYANPKYDNKGWKSQ